MMSSKNNQSELILDAAYKCVAEKGYANISLRDIAKEANVALSQLHYYFGSKKKLFQEIIKRMIGKYTTELEQQIKKDKSDNKEISNILKYMKEALEKNPELFKILFDLSSLALRSDSFKRMLSDLLDHLSGVIKECIDEKSSMLDELKNFSSSTLSRLILGSILGVAFEYTLDFNKDEDILDSLSALSAIFQ